MTEPSENIGRVQWLTFFGVEHFEGGKGGEGGVYPFHRLYHLSLGRFEKMSKQSNRRPILITTRKLKKEEIYNV
jgi:hypothetical protein